MDERVVQFRVGVVVLATVIIMGILILLFGEARTLVQGHYTVNVKLPRAPGIAVDTPVRKSGILIGRVAAFTASRRARISARHQTSPAEGTRAASRSVERASRKARAIRSASPQTAQLFR